MESRLSVSTNCPMCSAPLDFSQGSNAVHCGYCDSNLLVTGRKQVLHYVIPPKLDGKEAIACVQSAHQQQGMPCRVIKPQLYFVPYYHFSGHVLRWDNVEQTSSFMLDQATDYAQPARPLKVKRIAFQDRYIDRNFIACELSNACSFSLGVRPSVMRLELFRRQHLVAQGNIVPLSMPPKDAVRQGLRAVDKLSMLYRQILGLNLSVIYFPYWFVEVERHPETILTTVDAVAGVVVNLQVEPALLDPLSQHRQTKQSVIGFRPLVCPNCGWDLPLRPQDVIFFCSACDHAWEIYGQQLRETAYQFADFSQPTARGAITHLPFWVLSRQPNDDGPTHYYLPAFRYRRLKRLADLAHNMTHKQPHYAAQEGDKPAAHGCYYDHHDALKFAAFTHVGMRARKTRKIELKAGEKLAFSQATLTWFPFPRRANDLVDPVTHYHLPAAGLL